MDMLVDQDISTKKFCTFFMAGYQEVETQETKCSSRCCKECCKSRMKAYTDETIGMMPDTPQGRAMGDILTSYISANFGRVVSRHLTFACCDTFVCPTRLRSFWLYNLIYMMFFAPIRHIQYALDLCASLVVLCLRDPSAHLAIYHINVFIRLTSMLLIKYNELVPYCAKIKLIVLQRLSPTYAVYQFSFAKKTLKIKLENIPACAACGAPDTTKCLKKCAGCKKVIYCNADCQRLHWPTHKLSCA